ncbi:transient receptor potential cation channel subfamily A member 1-like isoform X3 [Octopus vulgaris]|uniref:Transient receptor potential cation channel subfamily A member 1-like isoform X3 n=1 Tax=Octopus vulgaris TaxID=6645 RepID=A0AA36APD9_OCTVU|nr:transient receptor potential cation channel subfamily A member 1-like isoform X3 [Octopus vulgaris]
MDLNNLPQIVPSVKTLTFNAMKYNEQYTGLDVKQQNQVLESDQQFDCQVDNMTKALLAAQNGNSQEFDRLYLCQPNILDAHDSVGQTTLHLAAAHSHISIMAYILGLGGDINKQENNGDTALHIAVKMRQNLSVDFLLCHSADTTILNNCNMAPLHIAADMKAINILQTLLEYDVDPNLKGHRSWTPLHYSVNKDHLAAVICLFQSGGDFSIANDNDVTPMQLAAQQSANNTLEYLKKNAPIGLYTACDIKNIVDSETNVNLRVAICNSDRKRVLKFLQAGCPIDDLEEDFSTPVHCASSQGKVEILEYMQKYQPEKFSSAISMADLHKMTPLHRAAQLNQAAAVHFLLDRGADINALDSHGRTPLLLAASKGHWEMVQVLIKRGANLLVKDESYRNFLHLAIENGSHLNLFWNSLRKHSKDLLNERDISGWTPLHYAAKMGHLTAIDDLMKLGAIVNLKNNNEQSPFHLASRYGRFNTCVRLLTGKDGSTMLNEMDNLNQTALHLASQNGHTKLVSLLLRKGAVIYKDNDGNTPLHLAAKNGYTQTARLLLDIYPNILDSKNLNRDTPLHVTAAEGHAAMVNVLLTLRAKLDSNNEEKTFFDYIIYNKHHDAAMTVVLHERWEECMELYSVLYGWPMIGLVRQLPEVCMAVLDRCQTSSSHQPKSYHFYIEFNFKHMQHPAIYHKKKPAQKESFGPLSCLVMMAKLGREDLLSHPVCENFLKMKWNAYGRWIYIFNLLLYIIFLGLLTNFVTTHDSMMHYDPDCSYALNHTVKVSTVSADDEKTKEEIDACSFKVMQTFELSIFHSITIWLITIFCIINLLKEIVQIIQQGKRYFREPINILEWILYTSTCVFILPFLFRLSLHFQWEAGALAIFFAWFNLLVFLQRIEIFGLHVVMCLEVLRTLIQALCIYSILFIAFGMGFYVVMAKEESHAHRSPALSILRVGMMILEPEFMDNFNEPFTDDDPYTLHFGNVSILMLAMFMLFTPIMLMNLLIGLAVGNIDAVIRDARLKRLTMQVELHADLESKLPRRFIQKVNKMIYRIYPNRLKIVNEDADAGQLDAKLASLGRSIAQNAYLYDEMHQQKKRLRDITNSINKHYELLRLIVRKMDISTEDDHKDEGVDTSVESDSESGVDNSHVVNGWSSDLVRNNLLKRTAALSYKQNKNMKKQN